MAISPHLNKVWKQGSFMAASLGEFVMNSTGQDVRDDGDVAGMANRIANAIRAIGGGGIAPPASDNILYGMLNGNWSPAVSLADLISRLSGYLPLSGGTMNGFIVLNAEPQQTMHPVNQGYLERRLTEISVGPGGGIPEAGSPGPYGRGGGTWIPLDGRYLRGDGPIDPGPLRIQSAENINGIMPALEWRNLARSETDGGLWRAAVGSGGAFRLENNTSTGWSVAYSVGYADHSVYFRGGIELFETDLGYFEPNLQGSVHTIVRAEAGVAAASPFPQFIMSNTGVPGYPLNGGKWRMTVGGNGNLVWQYNTAAASDFSTMTQALILRPDRSVEVYGNLQVDNDFILGRTAVADAWILRPNDLPAGWKNLYVGTTGGGNLDSFRVNSDYTRFNGGTEVFGQLNVFNNIVGNADIYAGGNVQAAYDLRSGRDAWVGQNLLVNNAIFFRHDGSQGWINCNTGHADFGDIYCRGALDVRGPATFYVPGQHDPVTIYCDQGLFARLRYSHLNVDLWTAGLNSVGDFVIADEGRAAPRMQVVAGGPINFWGRIIAVDGATIMDGDLVVANSIACYTAPSGGFNAYGVCYFNGPTIVRSYLTTTGADSNSYGVAVNNAHIYCSHNYVGGGNIWCGGSISCSGNMAASGQVTGNGGVNVPGGKLWVNQSIEAWASGGGHLTNYWYTDTNFTVNGTFEAKSISYLDGLVTCWNGLYAYVGLWVRTGSLTIENGDLQIHRGSAYKPDGGPFNNISSIENKKEITNYQSGLAELCRLRPVSYRFNGLAGTPDDGRIYYGILAEEALEAMPELKIGEVLRRTHPKDDKEAPYTAINSGPVVWALVNAVKELAAKVEALEARGG